MNAMKKENENIFSLAERQKQSFLILLLLLLQFETQKHEKSTIILLVARESFEEIPLSSSKSIFFRFRFALFIVEAKAHATSILCSSLHVSCRCLQQEQTFFNSNERDCIICNVECTRVQCFFRCFCFCLLKNLFFSFLFFLSRAFHRLFMEFYFPCKIGDA